MIAEIYLVGSKAKLVADLDSNTEKYLTNLFSWTSPLEPDKTYYFYSDRIMYSGIVPFVKEALKELGYSVAVKHRNSNKEFEADFLGEYRYRQEEAINTFIDNRYGIVKAEPGYGKTVLKAAILAKLGKQGGVIVPSQKTLYQMYRALTEFTTVPKDMIGLVGDSQFDVNTITIATYQTAGLELTNNPNGELVKWLRESKVMLFDEAHHGASPAYASIISELHNVEYLGGFSATPFRADDKSLFLSALFGPTVFEIPYVECIDHGILCPVSVFVRTVPKRDFGYTTGLKDRKKINPKHQRNRYQKVYNEYIVQNETRNRMAVDFVEAVNAKGHTCAVIVSRIEHANEINKLCPKIKVLHAQMPDEEKNALFEALANHEIMAVVTTLMDEAVDVPSLGAVALMAGGKSKVKLLQRIRCTRTFEGKIHGKTYTKKRGYILYLRDQADFLRSHSKENIAVLKRLVSESEKNEYYDDEKSGRLEKASRKKATI